MKNNIISENIGRGFQEIFDLENNPTTVEELRSMILKSHQQKNLERTMLAWIARHYIEHDFFPSSELISRELHMDLPLVHKTLEALKSKGMITMVENEEITGAYGVSIQPTRHSFYLDHRPLHVWCAIDSLGIPLVLNKHTTVHSKCSHCKSHIDIKIEGGALGPHDQNIVVFVGFRGDVLEKVSEDFCPYINFFCSNEHLESWKTKNLSVQGMGLDLQTASEISKNIFLPLGSALR
jgi:hypothetical protein